MAIFNRELLVYQRVNHSMIYRCWGYLRYEYNIDMMVIYTIIYYYVIYILDDLLISVTLW